MNNTPNPIRILLADDHPVLRQGIQALAADERDMQFVGGSVQRTGSDRTVPKTPAGHHADGFGDAGRERYRRDNCDSK